MHPKNPLEKIDYSELAVAFPPLLKHLKNGRIKDFKDPKAIRDLNIAILLKYYKVRIEIPLDKLIPIIPSRLDYILHIADLFMEKRDLKGLDIGTGASCIYPILGATIFNWHFLALDIDQDSLEYAQENVSRNNLDSLIKVELNTSKKIIPKGSFDFLMCNPPFYRDHSHIHESKKLKLDNPTGECTGSNNEMITEGGEYEFVKRMIKESKRRDIKYFIN
ncbi:Methyltransferase-like protein 16 [Boothiomyces macroporosus]|uniref:Methyltransferase-like protein 16 n=1 Tax=Boothiomyces macroporosus TaxID=261099 RepID=A0AAD5UPA5_9FUNG|nr:Methyltransferase-like protein 16 [Boothiomyces macroporosus]